MMVSVGPPKPKQVSKSTARPAAATGKYYRLRGLEKMLNPSHDCAAPLQVARLMRILRSDGGGLPGAEDWAIQIRPGMDAGLAIAALLLVEES